MIRALRNSKGPRLHPSTLSEFTTDKRPASLPGQDFVHSYVRACLRHRGDSPEEVDRQVSGWLASRTAIVVALGTSVTPVEEQSPEVSEPSVDLNLVCDPAELGDALRWLVITSGRERSWVATELGKSPAWFEDVLRGRELPSPEQWSALMSLLSVDKGELTAWNAACARVRHHAGRCAARPTRRRTAVLIGAAAVVVLLVLGVGVHLMSGGGSRDASADLLSQNSPCLNGGPGFSVLNHHSSMLVNNQDRPRMGMQRGSTEIDVRYQLAQPHAEHKTCLMTLRAKTSNGPLCLTAAGGPDIVWQPCGDALPAQQWVEEPHWNDGTLQWARLHSATDPERCLQQAGSNGAGTPLALAACSTNWLQHWRLLPPP
ncbi:helix-turn-helix domain-containing protein [Allokutzneria sp. NRRL B-24872]|uniref:helix-turn-helix domain-containing protein n=1 Tax=Allokutzneria sp. NRRL B-24872 TaxID=1137961 RepID=UPI000A3A16A0|nr:helix-turn-helix domain-containing protein [Allokutzneria sp. NRRL B-24872]